MTTAYPSAIDTTTTHPANTGVGAQLSTFPHSVLEGNQNDAIRAIETELGTAPSGSFSTVKGRLDQLDTAYTAVTYVNDWATLGTFVGLRYRKVGNTVHLYGSITNGTTSTVATLPSGFRPAANVAAPAADLWVDGLSLCVFVSSAGVITVEQTGAVSYHINMQFEVA